MNHEVVTRPCKIYDWLLTSFRDHFSLHQGNDVRVTTEFEVLKNHNLRLTLSINMIQRVLRWERQKRCSSRKKARGGGMTKKCCYHEFLMEKKMKTKEDKRVIKLYFLKIALFGHIS